MHAQRAFTQLPIGMEAGGFVSPELLNVSGKVFNKDEEKEGINECLNY